MSPRERAHPVDGSRGGRRSIDPGQYAAGYRAGRAAMRGGGPPRKGCRFALLTLPVALVRAALRKGDTP